MNRKEIENMPAGREMDALIAEKVMGWTAKNITPISFDWIDKNGYFAAVGESAIRNVWMPSEIIDDAWQIVEKSTYDFEITKTDSVYGKYCAGFEDKFANADTAPLAICRAALLATLEMEE